MRRYLSVDILRSVAILLMVLVHFVENLSFREDSSAWLYDSMVLLGGLPAPLFTFVSGLSFSLWLRKQQADRRSEEMITKIALRRGLFLFTLGIAFNFWVWLPEDTFNWDILTLIGTALMLLAFARKLPPLALALIGVVVVLLSPPLRVVGDYPAYWKDYVYDYDFTLRDVLAGFLVNGYFPLLPWVLFPLTGFLIGEVYFTQRTQPTRAFWWLAAFGTGLLTLATCSVIWRAQFPALVAKHYATGFTMYPASTTYLLGMLGFAVLCLVVLHRWIDQNERVTGTGAVLTFLQRCSTFSLTIYIMHHVVHLWPLWCWGVRTDPEDPKLYWRQAMSTPLAVGLAVAFLVCCYFGLLFLSRYKRYSFEAFMRWLCE